MNGERMSDVYELYAYKLEGNSRAGFSKAWLHESWVDICAEFKGHYPEVSSKYFATKRRNEFTDKEKVFLTKYFK